MCVPAAMIGATVLTVGAKVAEAVFDHIGQQEAHDRNEKATEASRKIALADLDARWFQEQEATAQSIMGTDRQARSAEALARVSAGESGVAGASVDALLNDIERERVTAKFTAERNLSFTKDQLKRNARAVNTEAINRINAVPAPNPFLTGFRIGGSVLNAGTNLLSTLPGGSKNG